MYLECIIFVLEFTLKCTSHFAFTSYLHLITPVRYGILKVPKWLEHASLKTAFNFYIKCQIKTNKLLSHKVKR